MRILAALMLGAWGLLLWALIERQEPALVLRNATGEALTAVEVVIGEEKVQVAAMRPGDRLLVEGPPGAEGPVDLVLHYADGREERRRAGWYLSAEVGGREIVLGSADSVRVVAR